jgi:hypothetical protein
MGENEVTIMVESAEEFITNKKRDRTGNEFKVKDIGRQGSTFWKIVAITMMVQSDNPEKVYVIERLRMVRHEGEIESTLEIGKEEYRFAYYIVGKIGNKAGKWTWGQFNPHINVSDLGALLSKAKREGTIL